MPEPVPSESTGEAKADVELPALDRSLPVVNAEGDEGGRTVAPADDESKCRSIETPLPKAEEAEAPKPPTKNVGVASEANSREPSPTSSFSLQPLLTPIVATAAATADEDYCEDVAVQESGAVPPSSDADDDDDGSSRYMPSLGERLASKEAVVPELIRALVSQTGEPLVEPIGLNNGESSAPPPSTEKVVLAAPDGNSDTSKDMEDSSALQARSDGSSDHVFKRGEATGTCTDYGEEGGKSRNAEEPKVQCTSVGTAPERAAPIEALAADADAPIAAEQVMTRTDSEASTCEDGSTGAIGAEPPSSTEPKVPQGVLATVTVDGDADTVPPYESSIEATNASASAPALVPTVPSAPADSLRGVIVWSSSDAAQALGCRGWARPYDHWAGGLESSRHLRGGSSGESGGGSGGGSEGVGKSSGGKGNGIHTQALAGLSPPLQRAAVDARFRTRLCQVRMHLP